MARYRHQAVINWCHQQFLFIFAILRELTQLSGLGRFIASHMDQLITKSRSQSTPVGMQHPLHPHPLVQVNPIDTYPSSGGNWRCDYCNRSGSVGFGRPYHCQPCSFDLCQTCASSQPHDTPAHQHSVFYMNTSATLYPESNGQWRCDSCHKLSSEMHETHSYHCALCSFDLCQSCFEPKDHLVHRHRIRKANANVVYPGSTGTWYCNVCGIESRPMERYPHHCHDCQFDVCDNCFEGRTTRHHHHRLMKADSHLVYRRFNGGWKCDQCRSIHNNPDDHWPWHCQQCEFDICDVCMQDSQAISPGFVDIPGPTPLRLGGYRGFIGTGVAPNPWAMRREVNSLPSPSDGPPVEFVSERGNAVTYPDDSGEEVARESTKKSDAATNEETRSSEGTDNNDTCIICLEQPKNATLIHGDTGHCCCCWPCGQVLMRRRDPCPICRAPIERVIRQFNS